MSRVGRDFTWLTIGLLTLIGCATVGSTPTPKGQQNTAIQVQVDVERTLVALDQTVAADNNQAIPIAITKAKIELDATHTVDAINELANQATASIVALTPTSVLRAIAIRASASPEVSSTPLTTVIPATGTAQRASAMRTAAQVNKNATQEKIDAVQTSNAKIRSQEAEKQAEYKTIDFREVRDFPNKHIGEKVIIKGKIFNLGDNAFQMYFDGTIDAVVVRLNGVLPSGIYKDSTVVVYGTVAGRIEGKNSFNQSISQPLIEDAYLLIDGQLK